MRRVSNQPYRIETFLTPLATVARESRCLDESFLRGGNDITDAFRQYAAPLIGDLPPIGRFDEIH
jgi:hypothetical protein